MSHPYELLITFDKVEGIDRITLVRDDALSTLSKLMWYLMDINFTGVVDLTQASWLHKFSKYHSVIRYWENGAEVPSLSGMDDITKYAHAKEFIGRLEDIVK